MTDQDTGSPYMIFILVFYFFITGLLGFIICHMLKERGYRCRTGESEDEDCKSTYGTENDDKSEDNQDTVEKILKCIIENEANMEAFGEMLGNQNPPEHQDKSQDPYRTTSEQVMDDRSFSSLYSGKKKLLRKESLQPSPHHHHTIHLGSDQNFCLHCGQGHSKKIQHRNQVVRSKGRPAEQTVFSVGRFRVTHMEKKNSLQNSTNLPIPDSKDQSDLTEQLDCEMRIKNKPNTMQESYNIHNMFRGIEATNASKQKRSVTLLGLCGDNDTMNSKENQGPTEDYQHEISDQLPALSEECLGSGQAPESDKVVISDKKSDSLRTLDVMNTQKIMTLPESKQVGKMSLTKSEIEEVKIVKANADSCKEFSVVYVEETLSSAAAFAEEGRLNMAIGKSL